MTKRAFFIFHFPIFIFYFVVAVHSGPMGPVEPRAGKWALEYVLSSERRNMEITTAQIDPRRADILRQFGKISYGFSDRIELYGMAGAADFDYTARNSVNTLASEFNGNVKTAYGLGINATFGDREKWNIAGNANYIAHFGHSGGWPPIVANGNEVDWKEWNLGVQGQLKMKPFLPYAGFKYSDARADWKKVNFLPSQEDQSARNGGYYLGTGVELAEKWSAWIEGRFHDESSLSGGVRYTFR